MENLKGFERCLGENIFGQAVESKVAASLYVWLGLFRGVRGFLGEIASGELLDSERVDEGDEVWEVMVEVEGDLMTSRLNP